MRRRGRRQLTRLSNCHWPVFFGGPTDKPLTEEHVRPKNSRHPVQRASSVTKQIPCLRWRDLADPGVISRPSTIRPPTSVRGMPQLLSLRTFTPVTWKCFAACSMRRSFV
jgi:hypothetical protein